MPFEGKDGLNFAFYSENKEGVLEVQNWIDLQLWGKRTQEGIRIRDSWINIFIILLEILHWLVINSPWIFDQQTWNVP